MKRKVRTRKLGIKFKILIIYQVFEVIIIDYISYIKLISFFNLFIRNLIVSVFRNIFSKNLYFSVKL